MGCFVVAEFLLTSASCGPSAIAEPIVSVVQLKVQEALLWQTDHATQLSVGIPQLQNIPFENYRPRPIVWHYLCDPTFSHIHTIPKCDRHTHTDKQMNGQTHDDGMYRA